MGDSVIAFVFHDSQEEEITKIVFGVNDNEKANPSKENKTRIEKHNVIPDENKKINEIYYLKSFLVYTKNPVFSSIKIQFFPIVFLKVGSHPPDLISYFS